MADINTDPPSAADDASYPKPSGWEYMTHEERYAALKSEPKPESAAMRSALSRATQDVLCDQGEERRAFQEARQTSILADAPTFTLILSGAPTLSLSDPTYSITASLIYLADPASNTTSTTKSNARHVLFRPSYGPLSTSSPDENLFSIYTNPACAPEYRIPHVRPNASIRPPREPDGSFTKEVEITSWDGWEEVSVGDTVTREVALGLDERSGWRQHLEIGKKYWLRCDDAGLLGTRKLGLDRYWRYGSKSETELPLRIKLRDPQAVVIPLEPSNVVDFEVVE